MSDFAKEMCFDDKVAGNESTGHRSPIRILKSPGLLVTTSGISSSHEKKSFSITIFLSSGLNEL